MRLILQIYNLVKKFFKMPNTCNEIKNDLNTLIQKKLINVKINKLLNCFENV